MLIPILVVAGMMLLFMVPGVFKLMRALRNPDGPDLGCSKVIKAAPDKLFSYINDFHNWASWSPFEKRHPELTRSFSGEAQGVGAVYEWQGNRKAGRGRLEIVESIEPRTIRIQVDVIGTVPMQYTMEFTMISSGTSTQITWSMQSPTSLLTGIMGAALNKLLGKEFSKGLANLKALVEH